jgi:Uma2 family endonuclease
MGKKEEPTVTLNLDSLATPISLRPAITLTDEELMRFSAENQGYKIERTRQGDITIMSPVGGTGSAHEADIAYELLHWNKSTRTGRVFVSNAGFNLPDGSCLSPDAAWLDIHRWNSLTPAQRTGFPPLCPEFIIEVRSVSDSRRLVEEKMQLWLDNGAQLAWLVDPIDANVTVYRPGHAPETHVRPQSVAATAPVAGFVLDCAPLWS